MNEELISSIEQLDLGNKLSTSTLVDVFRELRKSKLRRPDIVCQYGDKVLNVSSGEDTWNVREQMVNSLLDMGGTDELKAARGHIEVLEKQFPDSSRVQKLKGLAFEAEGQFDKAQELYEAMLQKNHANLAVMKRMVACKKAKKEKIEAVKYLLSITTNFSGDLETWFELADLYIEFRNFTQAAFCLEEIILIDPAKSHYHNKLADIYYTLGTPSKPSASAHQADVKKHLLLARKHYSLSLTLQNSKINRKAVYGVKYASAALKPILIASTSKDDETETEVNNKMLEWAEEQIKEGSLSLY